MSNIHSFRSRQQNVRPLQAELERLVLRRVRHAVIAISGAQQTGKKTLAHRFDVTNDGVNVEERPSQYYYAAYINLDTRPTNGTGSVDLRIFVIPPPPSLPEVMPPLYFAHAFNFSAMIFLCNVTDSLTKAVVYHDIHHCRIGIYAGGLPYFFIVGNKIDLDRTTYPRYFNYDETLSEVSDRFGVHYVECSAKLNTNVDMIVEKILVHIIAEQP